MGCNVRLMAEFDELYRELGRKIREARERSGQKLSQEKLAKRLGISRASIVNIEAGRQHAPLHLLWQIAEILGTDLTFLIPLKLIDSAIKERTSDVMERERAASTIAIFWPIYGQLYPIRSASPRTNATLSKHAKIH